MGVFDGWFGELFDADEMVVGFLERFEDGVEFGLDRPAVSVLGFWMTNTMLNVMMVVPVLMTSCQVSENLKIGPQSAQTRMTTTEPIMAGNDPRPLVILEVIHVARCHLLVG